MGEMLGIPWISWCIGMVDEWKTFWVSLANRNGERPSEMRNADMEGKERG